MNSGGASLSGSILILDCSTARGSIALATAGGARYWAAEFGAGRGHGGELFESLEEALRQAAPLPPLSEILVGVGPGSYSGVRQAIAAANGLALATGARLSGFASPLALDTEAASFHAVGDARRGTFYYTAVESRVCVQGPELLDDLEALHARLAARPNWPVLAVETIPAGLPPDTPVARPSAHRLPLSAGSVRREPPLEPIYLRPVSITRPNSAKSTAP